ncbi:class I histocompatibility antigen, F10 alpha chain-like isoform X7 [Chelonia mydas]|uniref:class I histocompatibility antigen, F10 alpha chain-like isoform X7 n=1 Tax=Chelonia mydas TaxID=8469 RepID=UPI001CA80E19|nr:class I histocompatibility antigen, F10 alpha chain-like isoform X7 [Chelonia mydas]
MALRLLLPLLGAAALPGARSRLHSLRVLDTVVSEPGPGLPWFSRVVYVDDQVTFVYTSGMQRAKPRTAWMAENESPEFWDKRTWCAQRYQKWYNASLNTLGQLYNQSEGFHIIQTIYGCDLREDNTIQGFYQDSYDGRDFLTFDKETMTWVSADIGAQITKRRWDVEVFDNQRWKRYLQEECIPWLRNSLEYGKETLQRKEPNNNLIPTVAGVITAVVLIGVIIGVVVWKKKRPGKKGDGYAVAQANDQGPSGSDLSAKGVKDSSERDFSVAADTAWAELSFCNDNSSGFREQSPVNCREEAAGTGPSTWGSRNPGL